MRPHRWTLLAAGLLLALLLGSCGSQIETPGEELRLLGRQLEPAYLNESYSADIAVTGGLAPYSYEISKGSLPAGLKLQGNTIRGTPTEVGRSSFTVTVSDANLSKTFRDYTLNVVEAPPAELDLNVPVTQMQAPFYIRGQIASARDLQAFRTAISWDPQRWALVPGSVRATRGRMAMFVKTDPGQVHIDMAVLAGSLRGDANVFEFQLRPVAGPSTILVSARTEFLSADGDHAFAEAEEGTKPKASQPKSQPEQPRPETGGATGGAATGGDEGANP
ncbi:MAG TPA: Ig domain-containing protein [Trueperaceae bacterium]